MTRIFAFCKVSVIDDTDQNRKYQQTKGMGLVIQVP